MSTQTAGSVVDPIAVTIFNILMAFGGLSLTLVVATAYFSPAVHRSGLWFRHMLSWILYSASFLLLVGNQLGEAEPPFGLCFVQAGLIYAAPTLCVVALEICFDFLHLTPSSPTLSALCFVVDVIWFQFLAEKRLTIPSALHWVVCYCSEQEKNSSGIVSM